MNWQYDPWMPIVVGYANSEKIRDFGVTYTDLTTKMDVLTWNTGTFHLYLWDVWPRGLNPLDVRSQGSTSESSRAVFTECLKATRKTFPR